MTRAHRGERSMHTLYEVLLGSSEGSSNVLGETR